VCFFDELSVMQNEWKIREENTDYSFERKERIILSRSEVKFFR